MVAPWAMRSQERTESPERGPVSPTLALENTISALTSWSLEGPPRNQRATASELASQLKSALSVVSGAGSRDQEENTEIHRLQNELSLVKASYSKLQAAAQTQCHENKAEGSTESVDYETKEEIQRLQDELASLKALNSNLQTSAQQYHEKSEEESGKREDALATRKREEALATHLLSVLGPVSVMCRLRPAESYKDKSGSATISLKGALGIDGGEVTVEEAAGGRPRKFKVDRVLDQACTQEDAFHAAAPWVENVIMGGSSCVFAYGATGAGKTYTLQGESCKGCKGLAHHALERLINQKEGGPAKVRMTMLEVYCDQIRDLLATPTPGSGPPVLQCTKRNPAGQMVLDSVNIVASSFPEAEAAITQGYGNRATEGTLCNERSSRSHVLLILEVDSRDSEGSCIGGRLVLVDLAGSENIQKSGADEGGKRLAEAQFINKSLSCLADVVHATAKQQSFVPYRNSRLTMLLEESLTNAKVLLLVHVSPLQADATSTGHSLQFASRVRAVDFGAQRRAQDQVDSAKAATRQLQSQLDQTKRDLEQSKREMEHLRKELVDAQRWQQECKELKQQNAQLQEQLRERDRDVRAKSPVNVRDQENQPTRPSSPYAARPQTPVRQRKILNTPNAKKSPAQESVARTPCGDLTNYDGGTPEQKDFRSGQKATTPMDCCKSTASQSEIVTPKHVPVIPLSPQKSDGEEAAADLVVLQQSSGPPSARTQAGTARYHTYDGVIVRSILRKRTIKSVKAERRNPGCRIAFSEELSTTKSPPKWYLDLWYGAPEKEETDVDEKVPLRPQSRVQSRPGTPRPRRDTPAPAPTALRWRG
eukprot:gnl/MRDRNA2_/MRDRNA2_28916_c0_seq1.p1 gnl/MRDRNA2_/MRDRNA2_28916_c0~~gnl/MRDRNA2_/MRDRNA2_28916_c0_seq1.p1  ORF type:complete len:857 (+),score=170.26 gnl/MRDRNA2_/MRDRNA2_28916_c0_seq1:102-2573(+)